MTTGTEVAVRRPQGQAAAIPAKLAYARELANSGLLPAQYRRNPANVLWAVEYGEMLGLSTMAAMTGVHVIEGKPTASAGLISGLVRQAGHRLRVWGDNKSATCEITRSDDPEHPFSVTWTLKKEAGDNPSAEVAGLLGKNTWKQYPAAMLKSRAITQCARDACEEVLYGLHYTPEELGAEVDEDGVVIGRDPFQPVPSAEGDAYAAGYRAAEDAAEPGVVDPWLTGALAAAPKYATLDACGAVWHKSVEKVEAGEITKADAAKLQAVLRKRIEELKAEEPTEAEIVEDDTPTLDPADPWASAIDGMASREDGEALLEDMIDQRSRGEIDPERAAVIEKAIEEAVAARFPTSAGEPVAA